MVQGKFKKVKMPENIKIKQKKRGASFTRRHNAPIQPKKQKRTEAQKIKEVVSKRLNKCVEDQIRSTAVAGQTNLSKAQDAVIKHNKTLTTINLKT